MLMIQRWLVISLLSVLLMGSNLALAEDDLITLNMKNADITTFITDIGQMTGKVFIIDPRVKGNVTIVSQHPMTQDEVYQVFISTLNVHGFTAVKGNGITKIIPVANVKEDVMQFANARAPGHGDEYVTRVLKLDQVSAQELLPLIKPMMAKEAHLVAYPPSNVLIVIDRADNVERIVTLINKIDTASNEEVEVIPLKFAAATDVVRMLKEIDKSLPGQKEVPERVTKYVADERTNSILLSGEGAARMRIKAVIAQLDSPLKSETGNIKVIYLHNAKAVELAEVLNGVKENIEQQSLTNQAASGKAVLGKSTLSPTNDKNRTSIQADEGTNALLITAAPDVMRSLEAVIKQLDIRRAQVLVEAIIVELSEDRSSELGVEWLAIGSDIGGLTNFASGGINTVDFVDTLRGTATDANTVLQSGTGLNIGITAGNGRNRFGALLHAIATDDNANILSTPSIITMDNESASIVVGQEVPFVTGSTTGTNNANPFTTITREKIGIKLELTPQINEGDSVRLKIYQEVSSVSPSQGASDLVTNQREIDTTVLVQDGATIVLGGLISEEHSDGVQKVPLLGDLPGIGSLFRNTTTNKVRRNLMVFIHPTIIRDDKVMNEISGQKYSYIRQQQLDMQALMSDEKTALLPEWDDTEVLPWKH